MTYPRVTGTLSQGGHPGSYNGQDAYNDMLVTNGKSGRKRSVTSSESVGDGGCAELHARPANDSHRGGVVNWLL